GEPRTLVPACHLSHTLQGDPRIEPALGPGCGLRQRVPLSRSPSLHRLRGRVVPVVVRRLPRYYAIVRLPTGVHVRLEVIDLPRPPRPTIGDGCLWDLPFPVPRVSTHAQGLRLRGVLGRLAKDAPLGVAFRLA